MGKLKTINLISFVSPEFIFISLLLKFRGCAQVTCRNVCSEKKRKDMDPKELKILFISSKRYEKKTLLRIVMSYMDKQEMYVFGDCDI